MTRPKAVIAVTIVAIVFAGLASWGVYSFLRKQASLAKVVTGETVVSAASDIPIGTKIESGHLKMVTWPKGGTPHGGFGDANAVAGRIAVTRITAGDVVTEQKLMPRQGTSSVMTYIVPPGHRAVTVSVNEVAGVAGFIAPNNRVDVVLTTAFPGAVNGESISKIVLQNVPVLAVGQVAEQKEGKPSVAPTVTLDLVPQDAEKLVLAANKGSLQLLLRNIVDTARTDASGATLRKVLDGAGQSVTPAARPVPAPIKKAPAPLHHPVPPAVSVEIIKGKERVTKEFTEIAAAKLAEAGTK